MSYILDALKKSELQRQRGASPSLLAAQVIDAAPRRPTALLYGLGGAALLLLVAGITIGMLRPWGTEAPAMQPVAVKPPAVVSPALPAPAPAPALVPAPAPATVEITIKTERQAPAPGPQSPQPQATDVLKLPGPSPAVPAQMVPTKPAATPESKTPAPATERPASTRPADVAPERTVLPLAELPLPIQQEIPKLSILFHIYSANPKDRMVGINDRTLREGDALEPGLVLEQITADGMILTYKGYRFLRGPR